MASTPTPTIGSFLFDYLHKQGVTHAFGIPGDFALPTFRWLQESKIELLTLTHEPSVGFAADGYARVNGLGVAVVTYCVGGLNMLNSIACAYAEKSPVLVISGGPGVNDRRIDPLLHHKVRNFDTQRRIFEEVTCATAVLLDPDTAASEIMRVIEEVKTQCRPGYIEIPYDVVDMPIKPPVLRNKPAPESDRENLEAALAEAVEFINQAERPVIIADVELHRHGLTDLAVQLADQLNIPIAATLLSKSLISETNPHYIGVYSGGFSEPACQEYVENSDGLILLGAFISDVFLGMNTAKLNRRKSLLANTEKIRVGLHSFDQVLFKDFLEGLKDAGIKRRAAFTNPNPRKVLQPLTDAERAQPITSDAFFRQLGLHMPEGATVTCDTGDSLLGAIGLRVSNRNNFLSDAYYLSMGFATPAMIGAAMATPGSRPIAIVGDGAFQMTGIELSTAAKYGLKPVVFVLNNDGYGTQRHILDGPFNNILQWDYTKLTELFRYGKGIKVQTNAELESALKEAFATDDMYLIEVVLPRDDCSVALRRLGEALGEQRNPGKHKRV